MVWHRVFAGCWHGFRDGQNNPCAILERNDFGRRLWTVEVAGRGRVTDGVFDCFAFAIAKQVAIKALNETSGERDHEVH